jgi:hypothetical protein
MVSLAYLIYARPYYWKHSYLLKFALVLILL